MKRVAAFLKQEIATILRVSADSLSVKRPVAEFGMDSLMGIELGLTAQNALGDDLPLLSMADDPTIERIAELFVSHIQSRTEQNEPHGNTATQTLKTIVAMHGTIPNLENTDSSRTTVRPCPTMTDCMLSRPRVRAAIEIHQKEL